MSTNIFVNLPVKDLARSIGFFTGLGYTFDQRFTDDNAGCLVLGDGIYAMLLTEPFFSRFTDRSIADTATSTEAILALGVDSRQEVDRIADAALAAGARRAKKTEEPDFMYVRSFYDLDGHHWEIFHMDESAVGAPS